TIELLGLSASRVNNDCVGLHDPPLREQRPEEVEELVLAAFTFGRSVLETAGGSVARGERTAVVAKPLLDIRVSIAAGPHSSILALTCFHTGPLAPSGPTSRPTMVSTPTISIFRPLYFSGPDKSPRTKTFSKTISSPSSTVYTLSVRPTTVPFLRISALPGSS